MTEGDGGGSGSGGTETETDSSGSASATVEFWSFLARENSAANKAITSALKTYEEQNSGVKVNLQGFSAQDLRERLSPAVSGGNAPDLAESGTTGLPFFLNDQVADHNAYFEETGLAQDYTQAQLDSARYRGDFWAGGGNRHLVTLLAVVPDMFKQVGIDDPSGLETWTDYRRAVDKIDKQMDDVIAFEETGVPGDLESYWGEARTAYTEGQDPWIRGSGSDPTVVVNNSDHEDRPRTDGMIQNCVEMARTYSSSNSASRSDEDMPALLLTGRAASFMYGLGSPTRYRSVKSDATFGWDGDVWQGKLPRLDANYGDEFGNEDLAGLEGGHGGHLWTLEFMHQVFSQSDVQEEAFDLMTFVNTSEEYNLDLLSQAYPAAATYKPLNEKIVSQFDFPQIQQPLYEFPERFGDQYNTTGAPWDLRETGQLRWTDLNETISQGIAGQHSASKTPSLVRKRMMKTISG
ncbi:MAG: ABC transporter substrate-binding protein [Haloferacaceae archaeon]